MQSFIKFTDCKTPADILAFCQQNDAILENSNFRFDPTTGKPSEHGVTYKELLGSPIPGDGDLEGLRFQAPLTYAFNPETQSFDFGPVDWAINNTGGVLLKLGAKKTYNSPFPKNVYDFQNMEHYERFYGKVMIFGFVYIYGAVMLICGKINPSSWGRYSADFFFIPYTPKEFDNYGKSPLHKVKASKKSFRHNSTDDISEMIYLGNKQAEFEACGSLFPAKQGIPVMFRTPVEIENITATLVDTPESGYGATSSIYKNNFRVAEVSYEVKAKGVIPIIGAIPSGIKVQFNNMD